MERRIVSSQAVELDDGSVGLRLELSDGSNIVGLVDARSIRDIRSQLLVCEKWLSSPTDSAE